MSANFLRHIAVLSQIRQFAMKLSQEQSWVLPGGDVAKVGDGVHPGQDARCQFIAGATRTCIKKKKKPVIIKNKIYMYI